jgi:hypothetical protein
VSPSLEAIVRHDGRLDLLCCLVDGEPLTVPQLSVRTGKSQEIVGYWVKLLNSFDLVKKTGDVGGELLYEATLDGHPNWVREAIDKHRR